MDGFSNLFAAPPSYLPGLLGEEETERLRREAQQSGLMNLGLSLLAGAGPSPQRQGLGQLLAQGVMAGQQASRNAYEQAVRDRMMQEQIAEQRRVRAEQAETLRQQQVAQQMAQGLFVSPAAQLAQGLQRTGAEVTAAMPEASAMDVRMMRRPVPEAQTTGIDMDTLRNILINAPRAAAPYMQTVEQIQKLTPKPEDFVLGEGQIKYRMVDGRPVAIAGAAKPEKLTSDIQEYEKAVTQGFKGTFVDYQTALRRAGASQINLGEGKFTEKAAQLTAETFNALRNAGGQAARNMLQVNRLEGLLKSTPSGLGAQAKAIAGNLGIQTKGLDNIQAVEAIINQMVPQQRPPGSGTMSDRDLELFKSSLPRLINTPGGNEKIISTIKAINEYDMKIGRIASDAMSGRITQQQADAQISALRNPIASLEDIMEKGR